MNTHEPESPERRRTINDLGTRFGRNSFPRVRHRGRPGRDTDVHPASSRSSRAAFHHGLLEVTSRHLETSAPMHINLDDFLDTGNGRMWTRERNTAAWKESFAVLAEALERATDRMTVYVLIGAASGKTTWARVKAAEDPNAILFDAILVKKSERLPILTSARAAGVPVIAVWLEDVPRRLCRPKCRLGQAMSYVMKKD